MGLRVEGLGFRAWAVGLWLGIVVFCFKGLGFRDWDCSASFPEMQA